MWQAQPQEQQEELFPDGKPAARRRHRGAPLFPLTRWTFSASYEQAVLGAVALIMAGLVLFSLGMERGKRLAQRIPAQPLMADAPRGTPRGQIPLAFAENAATPPARTPSGHASSVPTTPGIVSAAAPAITTTTAAPTLQSAAAAPANTKGRFLIQLATFSQPALAEEEVRLLRKRGYQPFLITTGKFSAVCVGVYATRQEAARHLAAVQSSYHDSFVRQR